MRGKLLLLAAVVSTALGCGTITLADSSDGGSPKVSVATPKKKGSDGERDADMGQQNQPEQPDQQDKADNRGNGHGGPGSP